MREQLREIGEEARVNMANQEQRFLREIKEGKTSGKSAAQRKAELEADKKDRIREAKAE